MYLNGAGQELAISLFHRASVSTRVIQNLSYENKFYLHENEPVGGIHFRLNGFALTLVLTQRQQATRKWPIWFRTQIQKKKNWELV